MNNRELSALVFYRRLLFVLKNQKQCDHEPRDLLQMFSESGEKELHLKEEALRQVLATTKIPRGDTALLQVFEKVCVGFIRSFAYCWTVPGIQDLFRSLLVFTGLSENDFLIVRVVKPSGVMSSNTLLLSMAKPEDIPLVLAYLFPQPVLYSNAPVVVMIPPPVE